MTSFPMNDYHQQLSQMISDRRGELAEAIVDRMFTLHPAMLERYGKQGHIKCLEDTNYHLMFLSEALAARSPDLFSDYVQWVKTLLAGLNVHAGRITHPAVAAALGEKLWRAEEAIVP